MKRAQSNSAVDLTNPKVDFYFNKESKWKKEVAAMRLIALDCGLTEVLKWGCPCYTHSTGVKEDSRNIVLIHDFKEYCAFLFFKGALMNDAEGILIQQSENVQSARQVRFTKVEDINQIKPILKAYIYEAIEVEKAGLKVQPGKATDLIYPGEFKTKLDEDPGLKKAFESLTPGRQRAYNLFFTAPKQSKTRQSRVEKCIPQIMQGKGLND